MVQASTTPVTVRLELLGVPRVVLGGSTSHALERKDAALLAMLALEGNGARARLSALLWPGADADKARNNLRQRLFRLRRLAGQDLVTAGDTLALAAGVEHDLAEIDDPENTAARSELLGTLDYDDCGALADWVAAARGHWRKRHRAALEQRAERLEREGRLAAALTCADRLVADNPVAEDGVRRLMRLHALRGDRAAALAVFQKLQETLARDLGTGAATSTQALAAQIESGVAVPGVHQASRPVILRPPRLIGRDLEWHRLELAWHSARLTIVLGEPGMGKSRLLGDFAATRGEAGSNAARSGDGVIAYALLARLARSLVARYDSPSIPWVRAELARLAPELGTPPTGALDAIRLVNALAHLVRHARGAGLAGLVIDDLHYADDASLEGLIALASHDGVRGLPVIGGTRASEEPRVLREWRAAGAAADICLQPLTCDGVGALLASLALPDFDPEQWVEPMFRHTGGNPLFVLETLRAILAGGAAPAAILPAPASVGELICRRLAQLPAAALELARVAAFAGQDFSAELASTVLRKHALDIADAWRELESAQILREGVFAHDLILEATLHAAPEEEAAQLHSSIAAYLESQGAPAARVAGHWHAASDWAHAARQFDAAARAQFNASRYIEAGELFRRAAACFELVGAQAECHAALQELAGCQIKAFDLTAARAVAQQLQRIAITEEQQGWALDRLVDILNMSREDDRAAQEAAREMQQRGHKTGKPWMIFNATRKLAVAFAHQAQYDTALALFDTQAEWVRENLHEWNVHVWFCDHGFVLDLADRRAEAVAAFLRAEMLAREHENWAVAYAALRNLAFAHLWAGRVDTAVRTSDQAVGSCCAGTGFNAAAVVLMDESAGATPRPFFDALLAGAFALLKSILVLLFAGAGVPVVFAVVAILLWICKAPLIGPILYFLVLPLSALMIGVTLVALAFVLMPVALPALWSGQSIGAALARVVAAVRKRLLVVLVRGLVLALLLGVASMLLWFVVVSGLVATGAMSIGILRTALSPAALMAIMSGGGSGGSHALAGLLGALLLLVTVGAALSQVLKKGWCLIYMQVVRDLDVGAIEAEMQKRLAQVRQQTAAMRDRVQQQNAAIHRVHPGGTNAPLQ
jgi:DNA-binding SARP family transcriptional activator